MEEFEQNIKKQELLKQGFAKESKSIFGFFIKHFRFTYLIILFIILMGGYALLTLPREADPEVKIPFAVVSAVYPGASPADAEELVTNKIEDKIKNISDLKLYTSSSKHGFSSVFVEFSAEADLKESYQNLRDEVAKAKPFLPSEAEEPVVTEIRVSDMPIIVFSLVSERDLSELKTYADIIQQELENISGVSKAAIIGGLEREFQIIVSQTKLANFNISLGQVMGAISRTNFNLPIGDIEIDGFQYNVRLKGKFDSANDLNNVVVATYNKTPIFLKDLAEIKEAYKEKQTEARIGFANQEARNTISIQVFKKTGGNIVEIASQTEKTIERLKTNQRIPEDVDIEKTGDNSWFIKDTLNRLGRSGIQTMCLIVLLLFIVLGLRGALITGLSVPIAFLMSFIFLMWQGSTLNSIVLYSLVISLGLMVDNSIIIMEGIDEYKTRHNKTPFESAILSVWNFKWAIISGTMTTVAAFLPMLLVSGILGEFFSFIPKTISATLISSLFVALVIIPTLSSRFIEKNNIKPKKNKLEKIRNFLRCKCFDNIKEKYGELMLSILSSKKAKRRVLIAVWLAFFIAVAVPAAGLMKIEMFSVMDYEAFLINIKLPAGSTLEAVKEITKEAEKVAAQIPELKNYVTSLGSTISWTSFEGGGSGSHLANITVNLKPNKERKRKSPEIAQETREKLKPIQGAEINVEEVSAGPPSGAPIEVRVFGNNLEDLAVLAEKIVIILEKIPGTINVKHNIETATGEFVFNIDRQKANYYGLDTASVASALRTAVYGTKASSVNIDGEDIDIVIKYDKHELQNVSDLENILIFAPTGQSIAIKQITNVSLEPSLLAIQHRDGEKIAIIRSDILEKANLQKILSEFEKQKQTIDLPTGFSIKVGGEIEEIAQSYSEMFSSMILAVLLIAFILVLQFNSFKQPFIILFSLPLAVIGVILGLNLLRMPFSFPVFLGIVSLAGIAVNDAIVLIDRVNKNVKIGMAQIPALIEAGKTRMQPIFLTSLTTIAGVFPLIFADALWRGFSITLIFGLISSTCLTLIMVPILYTKITRKRRSDLLQE